MDDDRKVRDGGGSGRHRGSETTYCDDGSPSLSPGIGTVKATNGVRPVRCAARTPERSAWAQIKFQTAVRSPLHLPRRILLGEFDS